MKSPRARLYCLVVAGARTLSRRKAAEVAGVGKGSEVPDVEVEVEVTSEAGGNKVGDDPIVVEEKEVVG